MFKWLETGKKKEEYVPFHDPFFRDSPTPSKNRLIALLKIAKFILAFEHGSLRQNAVTLALAPPPLPRKGTDHRCAVLPWALANGNGAWCSATYSTFTNGNGSWSIATCRDAFRSIRNCRRGVQMNWTWNFDSVILQRISTWFLRGKRTWWAYNQVDLNSWPQIL